MDPQLPISSPNSTKFRILGILIILVVLIFGLATLNFFKVIDLRALKNSLSRNKDSLEQQSVQKLTIDLQTLPISLSILKNPVVYQWSGSVEGNISDKKSDSITISKNNSSIIIPIIPGPNGTKFASQSGTISKQLSVEEVRLGDYVRGAFFVSTVDKNKIMGSYFSIVQPTK